MSACLAGEEQDQPQARGRGLEQLSGARKGYLSAKQPSLEARHLCLPRTTFCGEASYFFR